MKRNLETWRCNCYLYLAKHLLDALFKQLRKQLLGMHTPFCLKTLLKRAKQAVKRNVLKMAQVHRLHATKASLVRATTGQCQASRTPV